MTVTRIVSNPLGSLRGHGKIRTCVRDNQQVGVRLKMLDAHVRITPHHRLAFPPAKLLKNPGRDVRLPQPGGPGVPAIMGAEVQDARSPAAVGW